MSIQTAISKSPNCCRPSSILREHSEHWVERFQYKEAGPQLLLQAFYADRQ